MRQDGAGYGDPWGSPQSGCCVVVARSGRHTVPRVDQAVCPCYGLSYHMMTDASGSQVRPGRPSPSLSMIRPLPPPRSLTGELVARLTDDIISGKIAPGSQLPTEQELIAATGVSRTVVREAVAALRAEGLVITRQGVGAFVAQTPRRPFRIDASALQSLHDVIEIMELRTGVEVEAAGLAAERASAADLRAIKRAYEAIEAAIGRGED